MSGDRLGRRILLFVGATVVAVSGLVGFLIGANGAGRGAEIDAYGAVTLPVTPGTVALYGMALAVVVLAALFGAVAVASRFDENAHR